MYSRVQRYPLHQHSHRTTNILIQSSEINISMLWCHTYFKQCNFLASKIYLNDFKQKKEYLHRKTLINTCQICTHFTITYCITYKLTITKTDKSVLDNYKVQCEYHVSKKIVLLQTLKKIVSHVNLHVIRTRKMKTKLRITLQA